MLKINKDYIVKREIKDRGISKKGNRYSIRRITFIVIMYSSTIIFIFPIILFIFYLRKREFLVIFLQMIIFIL